MGLYKCAPACSGGRGESAGAGKLPAHFESAKCGRQHDATKGFRFRSSSHVAMVSPSTMQVHVATSSEVHQYRYTESPHARSQTTCPLSGWQLGSWQGPAGPASVQRLGDAGARVRGPLGTGVALEPMVLLVAGRVVDALLDEAHPELAFLAAWAMQHRHGREAVRVVRRAFELSARLDDDLQGRRWRGILNVLSGTILEKLEELRMRRTEVPLRPEVRKLWEVIEEGQKRRKLAVAQGKAEGVLGSLLIVLKARSLALSAAQRARIERCRNAETLQRWLERAASATRADEVFE